MATTVSGESVGTPAAIQAIRKTADQSVTNSTTLVDCTDLTATLDASSTYCFRFQLLNTESAAAGIKFSIDGTVGVTTVDYSIQQVFVSGGGGSTIVFTNRTALGDAQVVSFAGGGYEVGRIIGSIVTSTAGTFTLRFACNAAAVGESATVVRGSTLYLYKVS